MKATMPRDLVAEFAAMHAPPRPGRTLIVGSRVYAGREDRRLQFADCVGVDMLPGLGVDRVVNLEDPLPPDLGLFAHVECRSVLEHSRAPWRLAENLENLMLPAATIDLSVPFVWSLHSYPQDCFRFSAEGVRSLFASISWEKLLYADSELGERHKTPRTLFCGHIYILRTEIYAFGSKKK